jgi:hypothetical protein
MRAAAGRNKALRVNRLEMCVIQIRCVSHGMPVERLRCSSVYPINIGKSAKNQYPPGYPDEARMTMTLHIC